MLKDVRFSPKGLWTAPANLEAPKGGMLEARECILRRQGLLEPRPGMPKTAVFAYDGTYTHTQRLIAGPGDTYIGAEPHVSTPSLYRLKWNSGTQILGPGSLGMSTRDNQVKGQRAQGNVYLTTNDGLRKVDEAGGSVAYRATPPTSAVIITSMPNPGVAVLANQYVAYRVVTRRKDSAGLIARSAPSGRAIASDNADATAALKILLHSGIAGGSAADRYTTFLVGDVVEVYRTFNQTTSTPDDELYLVGEVELDSTDIAAGYVDLIDNTPDAEVQTALYTNTAQGGLEAANNEPPSGKCLAYFNGSLFVGYTRYHAQLTFGFTSVQTAFAGTDQIGVHVPSVASLGLTNGSTACVVTSTTGLKIGMIVSVAAPNWNSTSGYVRIASITNGTDLVLSHQWGGTTGSKAGFFVDSIRISDGTTDRYFPSYKINTLLAAVRNVDIETTLSDGAPLGTGSPCLIDIVDDNNSAVTIYDNAIKRFVIRGIAGDGDLQVWATSGAAYSPPLPEPTVAQGYSVVREDVPNGLAWSKEREPSHFSDVNFAQVGEDKDDILDLKAVGNALLVFKKDGVFRVSGSGAESGFRVDELDKNVRLVTPYAAATMADKIVAWADTGVYLCNENECNNISASVRDLLHPLETSIGIGNTAAFGAWACSSRRENEFCLGVPALGALTTSSYLLVYNLDQGGWTRWFSSASLRHGLGRPSGLVVTDGTSIRVEADPNAAGYIPWLDEAITVTISAVTGLAVTITGGSGWTPVVGDVLLRSGVYARVTAVTDATHFTVDLAVVTGSASAYVAYEAALTPIASTAGDPSSLKMWGEGALVWDSLKGVTQYVLEFSSTLSTTVVSTTRTVATAPATAKRAETFRFTTPQRHARVSRLYPTVRIRQAGAEWAFSALALSYRPMSSRVRIR